LWTKSGSSPKPDAAIQHLLSADDLQSDQRLFAFDIRASQAHARGLQRIGILSESECEALIKGLEELAAAVRSGAYRLEPPMEDSHSAIEFWLTEKLGELGGKIHAGRSRNDQVQVAMRLYLRDALDRLMATCRESAEALLDRAEETVRTPMPGYTHLQRAVPSTVELWLAGFGESWIDAAELAKFTRQWLNASPLGTAAGYGVNLPLDREGVARELEFERLQVNPIAVQNSRGQIELQVLACVAQATLTLRRFAWDLSLFACQEFDFVRLPDKFTTGSSLMPNKRNPDVVEMLRAQHAIVQGSISEVQSLLSLPSGYHRDLQLTKGATIRAVESALTALLLLPELIRALRFDVRRMRSAISPEMFATDVAIDRVRNEGLPFRDAYRQPATAEELSAYSPERSVAARTSPGACGDLMLDALRQRLAKLGEPATADRS
jgi:argininosuccinate lyase